MAQVTYLDPIDHLSGRIGKKHRTIYCYRRSSQRKFTQLREPYTRYWSAAELARQQKFATVAKATRARLQDPTKMGTDQMAFAAQTKYKTLYRYVFNLIWNE